MIPIYAPSKYRLFQLLVAIGMSFHSTSLVVLHDTPDGFVERALAVQVKGRTIELVYQVGINPKTMRNQLAEWEVTTEGLTDDTQIAARFCEALKDNLPGQVKLSLEEQLVEYEQVEVAPFAQHHKAAVVTLVATIPEDLESCEIKIDDAAFTTLDGAVRYACKARHGALVTQSNCAPIILRADRIEFSKLEGKSRKDVCSINAKVRIIAK